MLPFSLLWCWVESQRMWSPLYYFVLFLITFLIKDCRCPTACKLPFDYCSPVTLICVYLYWELLSAEYTFITLKTHLWLQTLLIESNSLAYHVYFPWILRFIYSNRPSKMFPCIFTHWTEFKIEMYKVGSLANTTAECKIKSLKRQNK